MSFYPTEQTGYTLVGARREASCLGLICKSLDEVCVQSLLDMCPQFQLEGVSVNSAMTRSSNVQVTDMIGKLRTSKSLQTFSRSFIAQAHHIFEKLLSDLKTQGLESGWMSIQGGGLKNTFFECAV